MHIFNSENTTSQLLVYIMKIKVGDNIRKARVAKNYTQDYLAQQLNITPTAYGNMERGKTDVALSRLEEVAKILETTPESLLSGQTSINITAPITNGVFYDSSNNNFGISEEALNNLTRALHRMCDLLESKQNS